MSLDIAIQRTYRLLPSLISRFAFVAVFFLVACSGRPVTNSGAGSFRVATPLASPSADGIESDPARTGDPQGRTLGLSATTVTPGQIIIRTIDGANQDADVTASAMMFEKFESGTWHTIYYLGLDALSPGDWMAGPNVAITANGLRPIPYKIRIPDVPPGTYRVRQDMSRDTNVAATVSLTLYATIQVVAP